MTRLLSLEPSHIVPVTETYLTAGHVPSDWAPHTEDTGRDVDLELVRSLCRHAVEHYPAHKASGDDPERLTMDAWLAPRLHSALRLPRKLAADGGVWTWLALQCREYLEARFPEYDAEGGRTFRMNPYRVRTEPLRNGIARLWWGAEMVRNGTDYGDVETVFLRVRTAEFALELYYSLYRPAAIAFARVAEGRDGGDRLDDDMMNALSRRLRVYLSLRGLEFAHAEEAEDTREYDEEWASHVPRLDELRDADVSELRGPPSGAVSEEAVADLARQMRGIVEEIRLEGAA